MAKIGEKRSLKASRGTYHHVLDRVPNPIFEVDEGFVITLANRAAQEKWPSIAAGQGFSWEKLFPLEVKPGPPVVKETFQCKKSRSVEIKTREGAVFEVKTDHIDDEGPPRVFLHLLDITEREREREARKHCESRYQRLVETLHEGLGIVDPEENIVFANQTYCNIFGYTRAEIEGMNLRAIVPPEEFSRILEETEKRKGGESSKYVIKMRRKDNVLRDIMVSATPFLDERGRHQGTIGLILDITERKQAEEQVQAALEEKEVLLKEIHHRVKNNLQTISSLLNLQSGYIEDKQALEVFRNSQERVLAMALIHEKLYQSRDLSKVEFRGYIKSLISYLFDSCSLKPAQIQLKLNIEEVALDIDTSIPLALVINELISNTLKHAFPDNSTGELRISLQNSEDEAYDYVLIVADTGIGFPADLDFRNGSSLGMVLVCSLVKQLRGIIDLDKEEGTGTTFTVKFKKLNYMKKI